MGKQTNEIESSQRGFPWPVVTPVVGGDSCGGIVHGRRSYSADSWVRSMTHVVEILLRGNAARVVNVAGKFTITELVIK